MSGSDSVSVLSGEDNKEFIKLKIVGQDENASHFTVKMTSEMGSLKRTYAEKLGIPQRSLRFLFKRKQINDNDTPKQLQMKGTDVIEVLQEVGGGQAQIIQRLLQCVICMEPCASPIYNCLDNGHLLCGFCHDKLKKTATMICPVCKCKTFKPSPSSERQSRQNDMMGSCHFDGCSEKVLAAGLKDHVKKCEYREIQCTSARIGDGSGEPCTKMFALGEFPRHAITVHKTRLELTNYMTWLEFRLDMPYNTENKESEKYWKQQPNNLPQLLCEYDGHYFTVHAAVGNNQFYWWITIYGGQKEADQYDCETTLIWRNRDGAKTNKYVAPASGHTIPVLPFNRYEKFDKSCASYAMVHAATATAYSAKEYRNPQIRKLFVRIRISKTNRTEGIKRTADTEFASTSKKSK